MPQKVIKFLIKNGADILIEDADGKNCLEKIEQSVDLYPQLNIFVQKSKEALEKKQQEEAAEAKIDAKQLL